MFCVCRTKPAVVKAVKPRAAVARECSADRSAAVHKHSHRRSAPKRTDHGRKLPDEQSRGACRDRESQQVTERLCDTRTYTYARARTRAHPPRCSATVSSNATLQSQTNTAASFQAKSAAAAIGEAPSTSVK